MIGSMVSEGMVSEKEIMTDKEFFDKYGQLTKLNNLEQSQTNNNNLKEK